MSTLWIREYYLVQQSRGSNPVGDETLIGSIPISVAHEPGIDQTPVTFSTSAQSAAFAADTSYIVVTSDVAFHYIIGANPTATTNALRIPAETLLFVGVKPGQKIAAIAA
jgi:hypothetical protein